MHSRRQRAPTDRAAEQPPRGLRAWRGGRLRLAAADGSDVRAGLDRIRTELGIPETFPAEVLAEAGQAADRPITAGPDRTDVPLVTIDPPESKDLDQAVHVDRRGTGFRVHYAIADVGSLIQPGGALDREAHRRGVTLYAPDRRTPLHPDVLGENTASLLPEADRPALLWTIDLDSYGECTNAEVHLALVRSRAKLDFAGVQKALENGTASESLQLLRQVGMLRDEQERARGGVTLPAPEQEVVQAGDGWTLAYRAPLPIEGWNAQISLLTGMAAARIMLEGGIGVLRTLPAVDSRDVERFRRAAAALHVEWPAEVPYAVFVRSLDPIRPDHAALLASSTMLLRGAGYTVFDGETPERPGHSALATEYAHATAPIRRLVDRYVGEVCVALCAAVAVPDSVRRALSRLPGDMASADRRARQLERQVVNLVEAALLHDHIGTVFSGVVVEVDSNAAKGVVQLQDPAVEAEVSGTGLPLGERVELRLIEADVSRRTVRFTLA